MSDNGTLHRRRAPLSQLLQPDLEPSQTPPRSTQSELRYASPLTASRPRSRWGRPFCKPRSYRRAHPTLCYHPDLEIAGICRICVVEVEGQKTLQAACAYPITDPIKIITYSPAVRVARRHVLDLLLSEHLRRLLLVPAQWQLRAAVPRRGIWR